MTTGDPELLRRLAAADAERPVLAGIDFTPATLAIAAARRARRQLLAAGATVSVAVAALLCWSCHVAAEAAAERRSATAALCAEVERLQQSLRSWQRLDVHRAAEAERERRRGAAANDLRCELAAVRSEALASALPSRNHR